MDLSNLQPAVGSVKRSTRIGRGPGSGKGGTSTRGHKGAKSRSGYSRKIGFEGGQMPLQRRLPKFGFKNINRVEYKAINLDLIDALAEAKNLQKVGLEELRAAGSMFIMWLGERITDRGIGNGISFIILVGIIARLPGALFYEFTSRLPGTTGSQGGLVMFIVEIILLFAVTVGAVLLVQGTRKVPVQYAKRIVGNRQYGGARQYIPLKVNAAGVMPIIFAQAIMFIPMTLAGFRGGETGFLQAFTDINSIWYNIVFFILIVAFTYFYTAITVRPTDMAENLKRNNGFIPGVKPGKKTAEYLDAIMSRITLPGSLFLGIVAILPAFARFFGISQNFAQFFGGTSLLIMVGVVLDTLQQVESHLMMHHYDGLMKDGKIKGRTTGQAY